MGQTVKIKICNLSRSPKTSLSYKVPMLWELSQPVVFPCLWATFFVRRSFAAIYFYLETTSGNKRTIIIIIRDCYDCHQDIFLYLTEQQQHRLTTSFSNMLKEKEHTEKLLEGDADGWTRIGLQLKKLHPTLFSELWTGKLKQWTMNNKVLEHWSVNFSCSQAVFLELFNFMWRPASLLVKSFNSRY